MASYLLTHRRAGKRRTNEHHRAREAMADAIDGPALANARIHASSQPRSDHARHVVRFEADPEEVRRRQWHPELIVESPLDHYAGRARPPEVGRADSSELSTGAGAGRELLFRVVDPDGKPAPDVDLFFDLQGSHGPGQVVRRTDDEGIVRLSCNRGVQITRAAAVADQGYWPQVVERPGADTELHLQPLPPATGHLGWWHRALGLDSWNEASGSGIRVGVIDTGTAGHAALRHIDNLGSLVDGRHDPVGGDDERGHGTHVAGLIGARPRMAEEYGGLAPGAEMLAMRVFGSAGTAHQGDIALALHELAVDRGCHLINLSLGTAKASAIEQDAIIDALDHGCPVISAVGNTAGKPEYPAAFDQTIAVTALGREGCAPPGTLAAGRRPINPTWFGRDGYFLASFCCTGKGVDLAAPGVGIISTVPAGWAAYGGTSMAAPLITGLLAACLSAESGFAALAADEDRSARSRALLQGRCRDLGLAACLQGRGLPVLGNPH